MSALREAVLLLLGYSEGQYEAMWNKTKAPPNPFKRARARLQKEIQDARGGSESGTEITCETTGREKGDADVPPA